MRTSMLGAGCVAVAVAGVQAGWTARAHAQEFYLTSTNAVNSSTFHQSVYRYTLGSGSATLLHTWNLPQAFIADIESTPSGLYLHTVAPNHVAPNQLWTVHPETGVPTSIGPTGLNAIEGDLAWNPSTGRLHGAGGIDSAGFEATYAFNLATGTATDVRSVLPEPLDLSGMTFDAQGRCWVIDSNLNGPTAANLHELNPSTGAILSTQALPLNLRVTLGLTTDFTTGVMYAISGQGRIYTLDTSTASLTLVDQLPFPTGALQYTGITVRVIPSPSGLLALAGAAGLMGLRRRGR